MYYRTLRVVIGKPLQTNKIWRIGVSNDYYRMSACFGLLSPLRIGGKGDFKTIYNKKGTPFSVVFLDQKFRIGQFLRETQNGSSNFGTFIENAYKPAKGR